VVVTTIGNSGCWSANGASLSVSGRIATIIPYDLAPTRNADGDPLFCTGALKRLPRTVVVTFDLPGEATVRVQGRVVLDGDLKRTEPTVLEKELVVN
jgi:hypothetical protein